MLGMNGLDIIFPVTPTVYRQLKNDQANILREFSFFLSFNPLSPRNHDDEKDTLAIP